MRAKEFEPKPRNFVAKNAKMGGAGQHKDKKKAEKQGDFKHKKSLMPMETVLRDKADYHEKRKALDDLGRNKDVDQQAVQQRRLDLDKEAKQKGMAEGWSDAIVARRTGGPRTPYSVYIKGKKWKDFENDDHARAVMDKLKAKFAADGRDPETITIAPTDMSEAISKKDLVGRLQKDLPKVNDPKNKDAKPVNWTGPGKDDYGYTGYQGHGMPTDKQERDRIRADKKKGVAERVRDPEDWDEGNTEPPNNFAVYINGKKWKVFKGKGQYADDVAERNHLRQLNLMAQQKSEATGKKWTIHVTGEAPTA